MGEETYRRDEGGLGALEAPRERHPGLHHLIREGGGVSVVEDLRRPPQHRQDVPQNPSCHPACRARAAPPLLQPQYEYRGLRHGHHRRHRLHRCHLFPFLSSRSRAFCRGWPSHAAAHDGCNAFRLPPLPIVDHARTGPASGNLQVFRLAWRCKLSWPEERLLWVVDGEDGCYEHVKRVGARGRVGEDGERSFLMEPHVPRGQGVRETETKGS